MKSLRPPAEKLEVFRYMPISTPSFRLSTAEAAPPAPPAPPAPFFPCTARQRHATLRSSAAASAEEDHVMPKGDLIPSRGAVAEPLLMEVVGELTHADLAKLAGAPKVGVPIIQRLRATHHRQAVLLAEGRTVNEVAAIVGCTTQRLVQLQTDPSFMELVGFYKDQIISAMLSDAARLKDKLVDVAEMAVDELRERLEDDGKRKAMQTGNVIKIAEMALDRTVAPPQVAAKGADAPATVTINFGTPIRPPSELADGPPILDAKAEPAEPEPGL